MPKRKFEFQPPTEKQLKKWEEESKKWDEKRKLYDPVVDDRIRIQEQLQSGASVFVLEVPKSTRSHCTARFCLLGDLGYDSAIYSRYRLNLKDHSGNRTGDRDYWKQPDCFYHVSCVEHMMDLATLLQNSQLQHEEGTTIISRLFGAMMHAKPVHIAIADWFDNAGSSFDIAIYEQCEETYDKWKILHLNYWRKHMMHLREVECSCGLEPVKPEINSATEERKPRLLSEVLAAVVKIPQIDGVPIHVLEYLSAPVHYTEDVQNNEQLEGSTGLQVEEIKTTRKPTDLEMKKRREELVAKVNEEEEKRFEKRRKEEKELREARKKAREYDSDEEFEKAEKAAAEKALMELATNVAETGNTDDHQQV